MINFPVSHTDRIETSFIDKTKLYFNRMGKTRDLFKKIRDTNGTFHAKMGSIKDKNGMDLTEAKILRRDGKNIQNCTKNDPDNHVGVITDL